METTTVSPDAAEAFTERSGIIAAAQHLLHRYPAISPASVLLISSLAFNFFSDGKFLKIKTIGILLQQVVVLSSLAIGQTLIVLTAGVDLAVGTGMLLTHLIVAKLVQGTGVPSWLHWLLGSKVPPIFALFVGLLAGLVLGAFHGFWVAKIGLPPFIVTLGTFYIFQSVGLVYSQARTLSEKDLGGAKSLLIWNGKKAPWPLSAVTIGVLLVLLMYIVFTYVLSSTKWGAHVYATGNDKEAARLAGIDVNRVLISVYMVAGALYAFGGWIQLGRSSAASSNAAIDVNLESITAVVIGGTSLFGGRGRLSGTLIGAVVVGAFRLGLTLSSVSPYWQNFAIGSLIILAVALDQWIRKVAR
jgi:fructose transport system permease protein